MSGICRKCAKCGRTRSEDLSVTYHKFPMPGTTNITKASAWAKFCWPNEDCRSREFLLSLNKASKVLCGRHFNDSQFYDKERQKLSKFAVPDSTEVEDLLNDRENVFNQNVIQSTVEGQLKSKVPFSQKENIPTVTTDNLSMLAVPILHKPEFDAAGTQVNLAIEIDLSATQISQNESSSSEQGLYMVTGSELNVAMEIEHPVVKSPQNIPITSQTGNYKMRPASPTVEDMTLMKSVSVLKAKLRRCQKLKNYYKNKFLLAKKSMITKGLDILSKNLSPAAKAFIKMQLKLANRKLNGRRFTLQEKILALSLYTRSPKSYYLLSKMCILPNRQTLQKVLPEDVCRLNKESAKIATTP